MDSIREATHAGSWYEDDPNDLKTEIDSFFSKAEKNNKFNNLKSIVVPHAGYRYSAPTAAKSFININPDNYDRVVVIGPSHHEYFKGCGITPFNIFQTPFGNIKVDNEANKKLLNHSSKLFFTLDKEVDENEHSIELETPFLKMIFDKKDITLVPLMVGQNDLNEIKKLADALYFLYEDPKTLFVVSSDFCHWGLRFGYVFYDKTYGEIYESIEKIDKIAIDIISEVNSAKLDQYFKEYKNTICGRVAIINLICLNEAFKSKFNEKKVSFECVGYAQSSQVKTIRESSVSYAAILGFIE